MVKHATDHARKPEKPLTSRSTQASAPQSQHFQRNSADEIIVSLANAYENRRARQVTEWERDQATRWQRAA